MPLLTLKEIADMSPLFRGRIGGAVGRVMIGTTVTSFSPKTTQWYRKTHKSEDYRHYCDEFRRKNDTAVVTWRSTAVVGWGCLQDLVSDTR